MPTTKFKNFAYQIMLPFLAPGPANNPVSGSEGCCLTHQKDLIRLIRKHHVLGSATMLGCGSRLAVLYTDSERPRHHAEHHTYFRVASITKMATSSIILRMTDAGLFSLDDEVGRYLYPGKELNPLSGITIRELLCHTSGLLDPPLLDKHLDESHSLDEVLKITGRTEHGTTFHYSNLGFGILGSLMECVLNQPVDKIFDEWLFRPLGLDAAISGYTLDRHRIMPVSRVLPYHEDQELILTALGEKPIVFPEPYLHYGYTAGSMYIDISSLYSFLRQLIGNEAGLWKDQTLMEMRREHASYGRISPTLSYGLGLLRIRDQTLSDSMIFGHQGFAYGCADGAFWEEETGRILVFLNGGCSECRTGRLGKANRDLLRWAFRKELCSW